jgi:hypothetical protein
MVQLDHYPPLGLKSPASMIQAIGYLMMRSIYQTMVADVLITIEVEMLLVSTVLTVKKL